MLYRGSVVEIERRANDMLGACVSRGAAKRALALHRANVCMVGRII